MSAGTKHDLLTEEELAVFEAPGLMRRKLHEHAARSGRRPRELRVLEWGCGRGRLLAALLDEGFEAYGVDVDPGPLGNGRDLFAKRGWEPDRRLLLWQVGAPLPFPNGFFDAIVSDQVFEHVGPLEPVVAEMARLTASDGFGLHRFPSHRMVLEPHLLMPFVHWLPKNALRYAAIRALVALGIQPGWSELAGHSSGERARRYYDYSVEKTWYRPPRVLRRTLARHGLDAQLWGSDGGSRLVRFAARLPVLDRVASAWRRRFHTTWMRVRKTPPPEALR